MPDWAVFCAGMVFDSVNDSAFCGLDKGLTIGKRDAINRVMAFVLWWIRDVVFAKAILDRGQETIQVLAVASQNIHNAPFVSVLRIIKKVPGITSPGACVNVLEPGADGWEAVLRGARPRCTKRAETPIFKLSEKR